MMGGAWFEETFGHPDDVSSDTLFESALETMRNHLGVTLEPVRFKVTINKVNILLYSYSQSINNSLC